MVGEMLVEEVVLVVVVGVVDKQICLFLDLSHSLVKRDWLN